MLSLTGFLRAGSPNTLSLLGIACVLQSSVPSGKPHVLVELVATSSTTEQEKPKTAEVPRKSSESFLSLIVRLRDDGTSEIVRATQIDSTLIERRGPATNYAYEILKDGKPFAAGFLPEGTFAYRSFKPEDGGREKKGRTRSATISLNVPDTELDSAKQGKIALKIYKIQADVELNAVTPGVLEKLATTEKASVQFELSGAAVAAQTKEVQPRKPEPPK